MEVQFNAFLKFDVPGEKSFSTHSKRNRKNLGGLDVVEKGEKLFIRVLQ